MSDIARPKSAGDQLTAAEINADLPITVTAGETLAGTTTPVAVYQDLSDNKFKKVDSDLGAGNVVQRIQFIGFVIDDGNDTDTVTLQHSGVVSGFTGLTEGVKYFVPNTAGTISTSPGSIRIFVGIAVSSTQLLIFHKEPIDDILLKIVTAGDTFGGLTIPQPIYQDTSNNKFLRCDANVSSKIEFVGFALTNATDTGDLITQFNGIVDGFSELDEGEKYYVQDAVGTIGTTPGTIEILVGKAISTTELIIEKGPIQQFNKKISTIISDVTIGNTTTETNLAQISIPAFTLETANIIKVKLMISDFDIAATATFTLRLKYGATTLATTTIVNSAAAQTNYQGTIDALLIASGATNTQEGSVEIRVGGGVIPAGTGLNLIILNAAQGTATEDSTGALNLTITGQWTAAAAASTITMSHGILELVR